MCFVKDRPPNILLVEDRPAISADLERILNESGFEVIGPAHSVTEALVHILQRDIDAALLDIKVCEELTSPLLDVLSFAGLPFVVVTAHPKATLPTRHGNRPFISWPYADGDIVRALRAALARPALIGSPQSAATLLDAA